MPNKRHSPTAYEYFPASETTQIAADCRRIVRKYSVGSGIGSAVPILGADIITDAFLATNMLKEILQRFGLGTDEISMMDLETKAMVLQGIKKQGCQMVGKVITQQLVLRLSAGATKSVVTRQVSKYLPVLGQVISASIGYATMSSLGKLIVEECVRVRESAVMSTQ